MEAQVVQLDVALFVAALEQVVPVAGRDPAAPHMMGVLIERSGGSLRVVATDRYRLAVRDLVVDDRADEFAAVVAAFTMEQWASNLAAVAVSPIQIGIRDGELRLVHALGELSTPELPIQFPEYEPIMLAGERSRIGSLHARRDVLLEAFDRCREADHAELVIDDGRAGLRGPGGVVDSIDAVTTGAGTVRLDPAFVLDALRAPVGQELLIELGAPTEPVVFRSADDGTFTSMVMPILPDDPPPTAAADGATVGT